jgi:diguanylate cyclase (GGDEF)-like protein
VAPGGDEFALLLPEQGAQDADTISKRIGEHVGRTRAAMGFASRWDVTIGTAAYPRDGETAEQLIAAADRRLYEQRGIALTGPQ